MYVRAYFGLGHQGYRSIMGSQLTHKSDPPYTMSRLGIVQVQNSPRAKEENTVFA